MRFHGAIAAARNGGIAGIPCGCGLGALPENLQNPLYAVGSQNSNYNDVIANPMWDLMRQIASRPYPELPYAGPGVQNPWGAPATGTAPPIIPTVVTGGGAAKGQGRVNLSGLGAETVPAGIAAFPRAIKNPDITGNNFWYTGQPTLNIGAPKYSNDAAEYLRHAVVDSNWDDVALWMAWALNNGMSPADLQRVDFGKYKFTMSGNVKKFYPFSDADYRSFFDRFMQYASNVKVDQDCLSTKREMYRKYVASNPRNAFHLNLSDCPLTTPWYIGLLRAVAIVAIPVALVAAAGAIAGGVAASASGGAGVAAGGAAAGGAGAAGAAATLIPAGIEVVTTVATPIIGVSTAVGASAAALSAAGLAATLAPPAPFSPPAAPQVPGTIETVTTTASAIPAAATPTIGTALTAGAVAVAAAAPAIIAPDIVAPELPEAPQIQESPADRIKENLIDAAGSLGSQYIKDHLAEWLTDQLGRPPTAGELQQYEDYLNPDTPGAQLRRALPWIALAVAIALVVSLKKKRRAAVTSHHVARSMRAAGGRRI